jgi:phosphatidylserine/phosphatidylglycerophosphate/cardiolipin synthase-like enzyme
MKRMYVLLAAVSILAITACGGGGGGGQGQSPASASTLADAQGQTPTLNDIHHPTLQLLVTPSQAGHQPFIDAIASANNSVRMVMYHLQDPNVINALIAAHHRIPIVQVIVDRSSLSDPALEACYHQLLSAGVDVMKSTTGFAITHEKSMVVDNQQAFITSMNMNTTYNAERDFGIVTRDASVIAEWNSVFAADVENSRNGTGNTPPLSVQSLVWSPVSSTSKLVYLIGRATSTIVATVENISDATIVDAFAAAAHRGVSVRLMTPECVAGSDPLLNYPALNTLRGHGVSARVMPYPATPTTPYMHAKMILVDSTTAYVGSINFTVNSTQHARETGIIFTNEAATQTIASVFETDWTNAIDVPPTPPTTCPAGN